MNDNERDALLARLDERTATMADTVKELHETVREDRIRIYEHMDKHYVRKESFATVQRAVFGVIAVVGSALLTGIVKFFTDFA